MMQTLSRVIFAFWLTLVSGFASADWDSAAAVVDQTTGDMLKIFEDDTITDEARFPELIEEIDAVLLPVVDFDYISKRVMGKYYRRASGEQRAQFSKVFKTTLLKTYARALTGFAIESYRIVPPSKPSPKPDKQAVSVVVKSAAGAEYTLVYFMLNRDNRWNLVNVSLDGINLRLTFKNQFANMAQEQRGKVANVIREWKNKVDINASQDS